MLDLLHLVPGYMSLVRQIQIAMAVCTAHQSLPQILLHVNTAIAIGLIMNLSYVQVTVYANLLKIAQRAGTVGNPSIRSMTSNPTTTEQLAYPATVIYAVKCGWQLRLLCKKNVKACVLMTTSAINIVIVPI